MKGDIWLILGIFVCILRWDLNLVLFCGVVVFVDVYIIEGVDVSGIFVELFM